MSHERLAPLMQARRAAMDAGPEHETTDEAILSVFTALEKGEVTEGQALRVLGYQDVRLADEPTEVALYRQAAAAIRRLPREER
jgi:hypothetical protein